MQPKEHTPAEFEATTANKKWTIFVLVAIGIFMSTLDGSIVNVALPNIMRDLQSSFSTIEWVVMMYLLAVSSLLLAFGRLSDIIGRRWVFIRGFIAFSTGSLLCGVAPNIAWLIVSRAIQAVGAAMLMACTPALIVDTFPSAERGRAIGTLGTVVAAGLTTGPALGGFLLGLFSWRAIFYINIPIGFIGAFLAYKLVPKDRRSALEAFDMRGAILLMIFLVSFVVGLSRLNAWGAGSWRFILSMAVAVCSGWALVKTERRVEYPIFDPALLKIRLFIWPVFTAIILFGCLFAIVFLMPFYLTDPAGYSITKVGMVLMVPFFFQFFISPLAGTLFDRYGSRVLCAIGMVLLAVALFSFASMKATVELWPVIWRLAVAGIGTAVFLPPNSTAAMNAVAFNRRGVAAGTVATARNVGMVMGVGLTALIFNHTFRVLSGEAALKVYRPELEPFFMAAFHNAMLVGAVMACIGAVAVFFRGHESRPGI